MRFELNHPRKRNRAAAYGWDRALGFFVEITYGGMPISEYDRLHPPYDELNGALRLLVAEGFLAAGDVDECLRLGGALLPEEMDPGPRRAAEVIGNFRRASSG